MGAELVDYLVEFYTAEQIRAFWKQAGDAMAARVSTVIHINAGAQDGRSHSGIALATPAEFRDFMGACKAAVAELEGTGVPAGSLGASADFSQRYVGT